jgi:hypothetical protein
VSDEVPSPHRPTRRRRLRELGAFVLGALLLHAALLAPSLFGDRVLLPADLLGAPNVYLPASEGAPRPEPRNTVVSDVVYTLALHGELAREQLRSGRWPLWNPYNSCGAPLLGGAQAQAFSPFSLLQIALPLEFPRGLAWAHLLRATFGALGAYLAFRHVLRARHGPAALGGWIWSLHGFATLWIGFPHAEVALELPWLVFALWSAIRRPRGLGLAGVAATTALLLLAGHPGTAATAFVGAFVLGAALWIERYRRRPFSRAALASVAAVLAGVVLGVALSAPQTLTTLEYLPLTLRATARAAGQVDIPPVGAAAAPLFAWPYAQGSNLAGEGWLLQGNHLESAAGGAIGLAALLVLAPLAFARRRGFARPAALALFALVFAGQALALPGIVELCEAWPLRVLQNNRFVFVSALCLLALAVIGLDRAWRSRVAHRAPTFVGLVLLLALAAWSLERAGSPPAGFAQWLDATRATDPQRASSVAASFERSSSLAALAAGLVALLALAAAFSAKRVRTVAGLAALLSVGELAWFHSRQTTQSERQLAYPPIPALEALQRDPSARIVGMLCLPAALNLSHRLRDVRGYDGLDPARVAQLLELFRNPRAPSFSYAATQWFAPLDSPLLDLVGVRYLIQRGKSRGANPPVAESPGYHVLENAGWLPRAFVPARVEALEEGAATLARLGRTDFDPRQLAFIPSGAAAPAGTCVGAARLEVDDPDRVVVRAQLESDGLLVLTDAWFPGWRAFAGERELEILRTNHAFRGVVLPAGESTLEFRYEPASFSKGLSLALAAFVALLVWCVWTAGLRPALARRQR